MPAISNLVQGPGLYLDHLQEEEEVAAQSQPATTGPTSERQAPPTVRLHCPRTAERRASLRPRHLQRGHDTLWQSVAADQAKRTGACVEYEKPHDLQHGSSKLAVELKGWMAALTGCEVQECAATSGPPICSTMMGCLS